MRELFDRFLIADAEEGNYRYSDEDLLRYANDWLRNMRRDEPDLFLGAYTTPFAAVTLESIFPLPAEYQPLCMAYVTSLAQARDDEHVLSGRAAQFYTLSKRPR
jgi:hypothetical protein